MLVRKRRFMEVTSTIRSMQMLGSILALFIGLPGCVLSLDPVILESNSTYDSRLLGRWEQASSSDRVVVSDGEDNSYVIEYTSDKQVGKFQARLGVLEDRQVLDIWPAPGEEVQEQPEAGLRVSGHLLLAIEIDQDEISVAAFEPDPVDVPCFEAAAWRAVWLGAKFIRYAAMAAIRKWGVGANDSRR